MIFVFFKLRFKSHCLQYFSNFSCNSFLEKENISESSTKSKEIICVLNNSGNPLSSCCALYFSNIIDRSSINKLKNIFVKIPPCFSPVDVLHGFETYMLKNNETLVELYNEVMISKKFHLIPNCSSLCFKLSGLTESYAF